MNFLIAMVTDLMSCVLELDKQCLTCPANFSMTLQTEILSKESSDFLKQRISIKSFYSVLYVQTVMIISGTFVFITFVLEGYHNKVLVFCPSFPQLHEPRCHSIVYFSQTFNTLSTRDENS